MIKLNYVIFGDSRKPLLVLLHGFLGCANDWEPFWEQWQKFFFIIAIDLPGHGNSLFSTNDNFKELVTFEDVSDAVVHTINCYCCEKFYLLGYSMGGRVALDITMRYQNRVAKTICISSSPGIEKSEDALKRFESDKQLLKYRQNKKNFLYTWYQQPIFKDVVQHSNFSDLLAKREKGCFKEMQRGLALMSIGQQPNMWPWILSQKNMSILYICGQHDTKYTEIGKRIQNGNATIKLKVFYHSSHMPHFHEKQAFINVVVDFLRHKEENNATLDS